MKRGVEVSRGMDSQIPSHKPSFISRQNTKQKFLIKTDQRPQFRPPESGRRTWPWL